MYSQEQDLCQIRLRIENSSKFYSVTPENFICLCIFNNNTWFSIYGTGNVVAMHCTGPFLKFLVCDMPTIEKNASSEPGLSNRKRPTCLGQLEAQLKKWVGAFPITPGYTDGGGKTLQSMTVRSIAPVISTALNALLIKIKVGT